MGNNNKLSNYYLVSLVAKLHLLLIVAALVSLFCLPVNAQAQDLQLDPPHDNSSGLGCLSCHDMSAFSEPNMIPNLGHVPGDIDDTRLNNICRSCHDDNTAPSVPTHSSLTTSDKYGDWSVECYVCHNQHRQENSGGKFIRKLINLDRIQIVPAKNGTRQVVFDGPVGVNSYADGVDPVQGICEVCHTQTSHFRNDGTLSGLGVHKGIPGTNCTTCHGHTGGFVADCKTCHDFPPGALVSNPGPTGSATAGAHIEHYTNQNISCDSCHFENFTNSEHNNGAPLSITIGFEPTSPIPSGGTFDGQVGVSYDASTTTNATVIAGPNGTSGECNNIYCHGNYPGSGSNATAVWDSPPSAACGTCHGASNNADKAPGSGSHEKHADTDGTVNTASQNTYNKGYECTLCHNGIVSGTGPASYTITDTNTHVNGYMDWSFNTSDSRLTSDSIYNTVAGTETPTDGVGPNRLYSTCNNVYCHSTVQTSTGGALTPDTADYSTPAWGGSVTCGDCHESDGGANHNDSSTMSSGSHTKHLSYAFTTSHVSMKCDLCHRMSNTVITGLSCINCHVQGEQTDHVDGEVDITYEATFIGNTGTYSGTPTPGDGYGSCDSIYCHSRGTTSDPSSFAKAQTSNLTWGETFGTIACEKCHDSDFTAEFRMSTGSHLKHIVYDRPSDTTDYRMLDCVLCHAATVSDSRTVDSTTNHVNKQVNIALNAVSDPAGTGQYLDRATNLVDISSKMPPAVAGSDYGDCLNTYCHSPGTKATAYDPPNVKPQWGVPFTDSNPTHSEGQTCASCHGNRYDWDYALTTNAHEAHINNTDIYTPASGGRYSRGCSNCHDATAQNTRLRGDTNLIANHVNGLVNIKFGSSYDSYGPTFDSQDTTVANGAAVAVGAGPRTCDSVYCHSIGNYADNASNWSAIVPADVDNNVSSGDVDFWPVNFGDTSTGCNFCHGDPTDPNLAHPVYPSGPAASATANSHRAHVEGENAGGGKNCSYCHYDIADTAIPPQYLNYPNTDGWRHLNGRESIGMATLGGIAPDAYEAEGIKTCTNIYCHSDGTAVSTSTIANGDTVVWGDTDMDCNSCHNTTDETNHRGPDYANGTPKANSHYEHASNFFCDACHYDVTNDGFTIADGTLHANGTYDLSPNTAAGITFTYTYVEGGRSTCSTISCHGGEMTAYWGHEHNVSYNAALDLSQVSAPGVYPCGKCHTGNQADGNATALDSWRDIYSEHLSSCATCHTYTDDGNGTPVESVVTTTIAGGGPATCVTCHVKKDKAVDIANATTFSDHGHDDTHFGWAGGCGECHGTGTEAVVREIHSSDCDMCHTTGGPYNATTNKAGANGYGDASLAEGDAGTWTATCITCHNQDQVPGFHGITIDEVYPAHQLSSSGSQYDCEVCHYTNAAKEQLKTHLGATDTPANCAAICHGRTVAAATTTTIVAKDVIDAVTFDVGANPNNSNCEDCHAAKGDYKLHGLTDDDSVADGIGDGTGGVAFHDKLGGSLGMTVNYTGKLSGAYGGLLATEYNCGDCHSGSLTSKTFTPLRAMQVHTAANGFGRGNCLTCHSADIVQDEISSGVGVAGSTVNCESCHSLANGNGPSGLAMYQYDGVRHHTTAKAQSGDCTYCHADPRPPTPPNGSWGGGAYNSYAATADIVAGADTGWGTDYPRPVGWNENDNPKQPGCRLCHVNAMSFSVDVQGGNGNHGYNISGTAAQRTTGLTVWANDFFGGTVTIPNINNALVNADPVTQVQVHRIESNADNGANPIEVENMGACLSCHSVQLRHAAPIETLDYDDWNGSRYRMPFDTLRYAPGRHIFGNGYDLRGPDSTANDWNDHRMNSGTRAECRSSDCRARTRDGYMDYPPPQYEWGTQVANDVLLSVPAHAAYNNFEGLSGMPTDGLSTEPVWVFSTTVTPPAVDSIAITYAHFDGSQVTVYAKNDPAAPFGSDDDIEFSYSNTDCTAFANMTWSAANSRWEATCTTTNWTAADTVTVRNNTTASALDIKSRLVGADATANAADDSGGYVALQAANTIDVLSNDTGDGIAITSAGANLSNTNCVVTTDGSTANFDAGNAGCTGSVTFEYTITDLYGSTSTATVTMNLNTPPSLTVSQPDGSGDTGTTGNTYTSITYNASDADADPITVDFYYDTDNSGEDGTAIASCQNLTSTGVGLTCDWTDLPAAGSYYVYGIINDGITTTTDYTSGTIVVSVQPVTLNGTWDGQSDTISGTNIVNAYGVPAGTNRVLIVIVTSEDPGSWGDPGGDTVTSVTYNGSPVNVITSQASGDNYAWIGYQLLGSGGAISSTNIQANFSGNVTASRLAVATYDFAKQVAPTSFNQQATTNNPSISVNNVNGGRVVYGVNFNNTSGITPPAGWTEHDDITVTTGGWNSTSYRMGVGDRNSTAAGSVTVNPTSSGGSNPTVIVGVSIDPL